MIDRNLPVIHYQKDISNRIDIVQWTVIEHDEVGLHSGLDGTCSL